MKSALREFVKLVLQEGNVNKPYDQFLIDDENYAEDSILVPHDIKTKISDYFVKMGLSKRKNQNS